eukprot:g133.t1
MSDSAYLKSTVGDALTKGMTAVAVQQPKDSVEFLGKFLINYCAVKSAEQEAKAKAAEAQPPAPPQEDPDVVAKRKLQEEFTNELSTSSDVPALFGRAVEVIKGATSASGVYLGRKGDTVVEDAPVAQIQYIATDAENEVMLNATLNDPGDGAADEEGGGAGQGITFDAWKLVEDENAEPDEDGNVPGPKAPDFVHVPNVIREPRMKFYGIPLLGGYLAVPITCKRYLHDAVYDVEPDEAPAGGDEDEDEDGEQAAAEPKPPKANTLETNYVLCLDRLGQGTGFSDDAIATARSWAATLGSAVEESERRIFEAEHAVRGDPAESNQAVIDKLEQWKADKAAEAEAKAAAEAEAAAGEGDAEAEAEAEAEDGNGDTDPAEEEQVSEEEQAVRAAQSKVGEAATHVGVLQDDVLQAASCRVPPKADARAVLQTLLSVLGTQSAEMYDWGKPNWDKTRQLVTSDFFERLNAYDPGATPSALPVEDARAAIDAVDAEALGQSAFVYAVLLAWLQAALELQDAVATKKAADEAAAAAAAEAAADAEE